ncbi:MAG: GFA family protein [Rhizobiaceae bacterium]
MSNERSGGCLCGKVTFRVTGPLRDVIACHCGQCRKQSGHYYAATNAQQTDVEINDGGSLRWYRASDFALRGFCGECGSALFWKRDDAEDISILAGSFDRPSELKLVSHIFVADKGDYYEINDGLPQYAGSSSA